MVRVAAPETGRLEEDRRCGVRRDLPSDRARADRQVRWRAAHRWRIERRRRHGRHRPEARKEDLPRARGYSGEEPLEHRSLASCRPASLPSARMKTAPYPLVEPDL